MTLETLDGKHRSVFGEARAQEEADRRESSRQAQIRMAGNALSDLPDKDWSDVVVVSLIARIGQMDIQDIRALANHFDQSADEEERGRGARE